jgi:hypothetical protein
VDKKGRIQYKINKRADFNQMSQKLCKNRPKSIQTHKIDQKVSEIDEKKLQKQANRVPKNQFSI